MYKKLIINVTPHETRVALLEDGDLAELYIDRNDQTDVAGNVYKGRVQRVLPGMQAAFVDIGLNQAAFLYVDDVVIERDQALEAALLAGQPTDDTENGADVSRIELDVSTSIEDMLDEGQDILVHVAKSPIGTKGARVTTHISLPGRFLVLMPTTEHIGVSRRIEDETERRRLKEMVAQLRREKCGYIVRTAGEGIASERLAEEMHFLDNLWQGIQRKYNQVQAPALLHKELAISLRAVRDLLTHEAERLVIDSADVYHSVLDFLNTYMPKLKDNVELYTGGEPIFDAFNLEGDISRALKRKVWLKSGGYIVIDQTEALVAIDVNTGRYVGKHNLEETILKTNLEAVKEIAYQIRLRDIGGLIIIDFIDMAKKSNQEKVFTALEDSLKKDKSKTHVLPISEMGLVQMTRKRIKKSVNRLLCEPCFYCDGEGYLLSKQSICYNIYRDALRDAQDMAGVKFTVRTNPEIAELLHGEENHIVVELEKNIGKQVIIYPDKTLHLEEFKIFEIYQK